VKPNVVGQQRIWQDPDRPRLEDLPAPTRRKILQRLAEAGLLWVRPPPADKRRDPDREEKRHD
jgi:hypothetical protein